MDRNVVFNNELQQMVIPLFQSKDELVWSGNDSGTLSLKEAYNLVHSSISTQQWPNLFWSRVIPPSKSFLIWRILHHKVPTDDNLWKRGCHIVSMCSLCGCNYETAEHLFLFCSFANRIWSWLSSKFAIQIDTSSMTSVL